MEEEKQTYQIEYEEFIKNYNSGTTNGEGVGIVIARLSQYFTEANLDYAEALIVFNKKAAEIEEEVDDNGKAISSSKAKVKASATNESNKLIKAKAHLENIEQSLNSLKALQRGLLAEQSFSGAM